MNDNGNKYAMAALKDRRARVAGEIFDIKRQMAKKKQILAHIDETIKVFDPDYKVGSIRPKKAYQHVRLFGQGELQRLVLGALRESGQPMACHEVAAVISKKLGQEPHQSMVARVRCNLVYLRRHKGRVLRTGEGLEARWTLAADGHSAV